MLYLQQGCLDWDPKEDTWPKQVICKLVQVENFGNINIYIYI
jgi:hypothetical protein